MFNLRISLFCILSACFINCSASSGATIPAIIDSLTMHQCVNADINFSVTMPQLNDDVVYNISISQTPASGNPALLPYDYLIYWELTGRENPVKGFSAYFNGHHYRFANERLQEYHTQWDSIPFMSINGSGGVQRQAQFANLLPAAIGNELRRMMSDNRYTLTIHTDTVISGIPRTVVNSVMNIHGSVAMEGEYILSSETFMPVCMILENNPGALSEQTVTVKYSQVSTSAQCDPITEQTLMDKYPEVFEKFRESNFRIENLPGTRLPGFALPTSTGERYSRHSSDKFRTPTIIALMDATTGFSSELVKDVRSAISSLPYSADVIWAFVNNDIDSIEAIVPSILPGEHLLTSARSLVRDYGAASLPVLIFVNTDGSVADVLLGYNNDVSEIVIQKMALIQP
mgnify:CR=1 FL=1